MLTFVVPVRDQRGVENWAGVRACFEQTLASLNGQTSDAYEIVVVANREADLPEVGPRGRVVWVNFELLRLPRDKDDRGYLSLVRYDKGRRVMAGLIAARPTGHVMVVDFDDLVSRRLASMTEWKPNAPGWFVRSGWLFDPTNSAFRLPRSFSGYCGTSLILHSRHLEIPQSLDEADSGYFMAMFGSHRQARKRFDELGARLKPLPFDGAMYRIGHPGATSRSGQLSEWLDKYCDERPDYRQKLEAAIGPVTADVAEDFSAPWLAAGDQVTLGG